MPDNDADLEANTDAHAEVEVEATPIQAPTAKRTGNSVHDFGPILVKFGPTPVKLATQMRSPLGQRWPNSVGLSPRPKTRA